MLILILFNYTTYHHYLCLLLEISCILLESNVNINMIRN